MKIRQTQPPQMPVVRRPEQDVSSLERQLGFGQQNSFSPSQRPLVNLNGAPPPPQQPTAPGQTQATGLQTGAPLSEEAGYKQLISADIKTAYGRDATQADFDYWLPKMEGPNDSGFVTGGQMSATQYWHQRLLGWQAGGSDQATQGPYAHSSDAIGPVSAATDVVPGVAPGHVAVGESSSSQESYSSMDFGTNTILSDELSQARKNAKDDDR